MAEGPTILATSGGLRANSRGRAEFHRLVEYGVEVSGAHGRSPKIATLGTASGDQRAHTAIWGQAAATAGFEHTPVED